jgi:O-antigen ligase
LRYFPSVEFAYISVKEKFLKLLDISLLLLFAYALLTSQSAPMFSYLVLQVLLVLVIALLAHDKSFEIPEKTIFLLIAAFLVIQFVTSLTSIDPRQSITVLKIRLFYYTIFLVSILLVKTQNRLAAALASLIIFTSFVSAMEIYRFAADIYSLHISPAQGRIGYFLHPITTGEIKMLVLFIIFPFLLIKERYILPKVWLVILSVPIFISFLFAYARGAFIAFFCGLIIVGALRNRKVIYGAVIFLAVYFLVLPGSVNQRMLSLSKLNDRSVNARMYMTETGIQIAKDNLLFGVGSIGLRNIYETYRKPTIWGEGDQLHNNVIQILVTMGVFGLIAWLAMMIYIFKRQIEIYRQTRGNNVPNALALSSLVSMIAFQICGLTDWGFADYSFVVLFWLSVSLTFLAKKFMNESHAMNS